ncbi:MAG: hypothetical protein J5792_06045 [Bacteroidales bacterium]|nr:hypothetical protein [Bacteroidales bacterium]
MDFTTSEQIKIKKEVRQKHAVMHKMLKRAKKFQVMLFALLAATVTLTSCNPDEPDNGKNGNNGNQPVAEKSPTSTTNNAEICQQKCIRVEISTTFAV